MIFDTHAHYDDKQFDIDRQDILSAIEAEGVGTIVNASASYRSCERVVKMAQEYPFMYAMVGVSVSMGGIFSTYYISLSIFLAYAMSYPDAQILLWFVIPIKMKWMAYVYIAFIVYEMLSYIRIGAWYMIVPIIASLLNFILFYFGMKDYRRYSPKQVKRRQEFKRAMSQAQANQFNGVTKHKCAICGRTEQTNPELEFRFCSRCNGNYEYCQDHLFTHEHVK